MTCIECGGPVGRENIFGFCGKCQFKSDICKYEGCDNDIASHNRSGYCKEHREYYRKVRRIEFQEDLARGRV